MKTYTQLIEELHETAKSQWGGKLWKKRSMRVADVIGTQSARTKRANVPTYKDVPKLEVSPERKERAEKQRDEALPQLHALRTSGKIKGGTHADIERRFHSRLRDKHKKELVRTKLEITPKDAKSQRDAKEKMTQANLVTADDYRGARAIDKKGRRGRTDLA